MKDTKEKDTSVAELTKEDYQKIHTILQQLSGTNLVTPQMYIQEVQPLMVKIQPLTQ